MEPWEFNLRHLRGFVKTYELGTLLAASKAVHISQPALTQGLSRLEDQLNTCLFERQSDGMAPTEAAHLLAPRASAALDLIRSARVTHAQVRAFVALARKGNYPEASATTGLAKASLHRAIADLEASLGTRLAERRGRSIELTTAGKATARRYRIAHAELAAAIDEIRQLQGKQTGRLAIGAMPLCRARVLPSSIVAFQEDHPGSQVIVAEGSHVELIEPLRDGELDFLIGALRDPPPGPDLIQEPLFDDRPVILARSDHPLARKTGPVTLEDIASFEWCVPQSGIPLRDSWEAMFEDAGIQCPRVQVECGSVITIRQILMKTDCLTLLSPDQVAVELEAGWLAVLTNAPEALNRTIGLTYRENWRPTKLQADFLQTLKSTSANTPSFA